MDNDNIFEEDGSYRVPHPQSSYSDASFSPAGDVSEPTRFYAPAKKAERTSSGKKENSVKTKRGRPVLTAVLCLAFACIGCLAGMFVMNHRYTQNISELESRMESLEKSASAQTLLSEAQKASENTPAEVPAASSESPARIYADACSSVVGITSEITYTNFFGMRSSSAVSGTGFIISEDGYIVTNYHVIESAVSGKSRISAVFHDGGSYDAELVGIDPDGDLAVLKIDNEHCIPSPLGDSSALNVGDEVFAVGNPLGELSFTMTSGRVSALDRSIVTDSNSVPISMFQIDAPVNSGNSGGPLYNNLGQVVGVVTAKYSSSSIEGIGFAIPINHVRDISYDLITKGYVTGKPLLGVLIDQRYTSTYSFYYQMPLGAFVNAVDKGSCAYQSGIRPGDIITALDDAAVESLFDLQRILSQYRAGDQLAVTVYHEGKNYTLPVTLDENRGNADYY